MGDARYGRRKVAGMIAQIEALRQAIRAEGPPSVQDAWDAVEEHIDAAYGWAAEREAVREAAEHYRAIAENVGGCTDGGCVVLRPKGMHTNGGCRCCYRMTGERERGVNRLLLAAQGMMRAALSRMEG